MREGSQYAWQSGRLRSAFSLIELLSVLTVTAILVAIAIPALGRVLESSRTSKCSGNLRNIGTAVHLYINDNNGAFPPAAQGPFGYWYNLLNPYMEGSNAATGDIDRPAWQHCPSKKVVGGNHEVVGYGWNQLGFGNRTYGDPPDSNAFASIHKLLNPSEVVIIGDSKDEDVHPENNWEHRYIYAATGFWRNHAQRHNGGGNYLYVDGRVEWMTPKTLQGRLPDVFTRKEQ